MASGLHLHPRLLFFLRYWLPLIGYVGLIFTLSAQPHLRAPIRFDLADKVIHAFEYAGLGVLLLSMLRASNPSRPPVISALMAIAAGMAIGAADENFQRLTPGRYSDVLDWVADSVGVVAAQVGALVWSRLRGM